MRQKTRRIGAGQILKLLETKHQGDLFIPECKNGKTQGHTELLILDAWAMRKSWANPLLTGYEIKVSRSDFVRDTKWMGYLPLCNELYFAAPQGLIDPSELADEVGLIVPSKNLTRLFVKKKAKYRKIEPPVNLYLYVLMARMVPGDPWLEQHKQKRNYEYWCEWLEQKQKGRLLGRSVSRALGRRVQQEIDSVAKQNTQLEKENSRLREVKMALENLGLTPHCVYSWDVERKVKELQGKVPKKLRDQLDATIRSLDAFSSELKKLEGDDGKAG